MTYYADLEKCPVHDVDRWSLVAVGWLDCGHAYPTGESTPDLIRKIAEFALVEQPDMYVSAGFHPCNLEPCNGSLYGVLVPGFERFLGSCEIFVPSLTRSATLYCAPDLILHYISEHRYAPPQEFVQSVLNTSAAEMPMLNARDS